MRSYLYDISFILMVIFKRNIFKSNFFILDKLKLVKSLGELLKKFIANYISVFLTQSNLTLIRLLIWFLLDGNSFYNFK